MKTEPCTEEGCARASYARGLCKEHHHERREAGTLPPRAIDAGFHRLSEVDTEARTAVCSICGPTRIRVRIGRSHQCMYRRAKEWERSSSAQARRRQKYGLTESEMRALVDRSEGKCMICDAELNGDFHIDHCHESGAVRGILCKRCNWALGWFDDDPTRILAAHLYLTANGR